MTGSSSGIGAAVAVKLAAAGYSVLATARSADKLAAVVAECREQAPPSTVDRRPGIASSAHRRRLGVVVADTFAGRLDVRVNNAGGFRTTRLSTASDEEMRELLQINICRMPVVWA